MSHIDRMIKEKEDLEVKINALKAFINEGEGGIFANLDNDEKNRMFNQALYMEGYLEMLSQRLSAANS